MLINKHEIVVRSVTMLFKVIFFMTTCLFIPFNLCLGNPNMVMALAGNKADLLDAKKVAAEASIPFFLLPV